MIQIAIVGGGVAGAYCALQLAKSGLRPTIFDHSHPREKPCGGLVSPEALKWFPLLEQLKIEHTERKRLYFVSPSGKKICVHLRKERVFGFSRLELDECLLKTAVDKGSELIEERVTSVERKNDLWQVKTQGQTYFAKNLIGADGVNSIVRKEIIGPLDLKDKGICFGYFVKGLENEEITVNFSPYRKGYIWVIPRLQSTSIGIGCSEIKFSNGLKKELDVFIQHNFPEAKRISKWVALIPNIKSQKAFRAPLAGTNWILIGDAAGHASPSSGEGILYALLDGELAAQALRDEKPWMFNMLWRQTYGMAFFLDIKMRNWIYKKGFCELYCKYLKLDYMIRL
jgi:geranylgeranyl reductase family protein